MNKPSISLIVMAALLVTAASYTSASERSSVTVAAPWEIASVDPAVSGFALQRMQIMETLVDADAKGRLRPGLATSWSVSDDALSWTFRLRSGVTFHDGSALTADAVVAALIRAVKQPGVLKKAPIAGIKAVEGAILIELTGPFAALPALLTHATTIIPSPVSFDDEGKPVAAIGTGPFKVAKLAPPQRMDIIRYEGYWGDAPKLISARYLAAGRAETRALLAESGDADLVFTLDPAGYARLKDVSEVKIQVVSIPRVVTIKLNTGHPFLAKAKARQALSLAIDRQGIAAGITRFPEAAATQLFPPALGNWHNPSLPPLDHDPETATQLLSDLGWKKGDDGILRREGKRFSLLLRTFPDRPDLAGWIKNRSPYSEKQS